MKFAHSSVTLASASGSTLGRRTWYINSSDPTMQATSIVPRTIAGPEPGSCEVPTSYAAYMSKLNCVRAWNPPIRAKDAKNAIGTYATDTNNAWNRVSFLPTRYATARYPVNKEITNVK